MLMFSMKHKVTELCSLHRINYFSTLALCKLQLPLNQRPLWFESQEMLGRCSQWSKHFQRNHTLIRENSFLLAFGGTLQVPCICSSLYLARAESLLGSVRFMLILQHLAAYTHIVHVFLILYIK